VIQINTSIEINRPVSEVFNFVADFSNNPKWMPVQSVKKISDGAIGQGTRFKQQFELMGANYEVDCVITAFELDKKIAFNYDAPLFNWRGEYTFAPENNGTRLTATGNISLSGPYKMAETMFASKIRQLITETAPRLKQVLES